MLFQDRLDLKDPLPGTPRLKAEAPGNGTPGLARIRKLGGCGLRY